MIDTRNVRCDFTTSLDALSEEVYLFPVLFQTEQMSAGLQPGPVIPPKKGGLSINRGTDKRPVDTDTSHTCTYKSMPLRW